MVICQSNNSKNNSQIPLQLWHSFLPWCAMLSRSAMSHNPLDCCSLLQCRDDFQWFSILAFSWWGSKESAFWWVNDRALHQVKPNGYNIQKIRKFLCLQFVLKKQKFLGKKAFKTIYASRNHPPHPLPHPQLCHAFTLLGFKIFVIVYSPLHTLAMGLAVYWNFGKLVI